MKNILTILITVFLTLNLLAQVPEKMKYQAVIRDSKGHVIVNQAIGMQISILQGDLPGTVVYTETQSLLSNANGLTSTEIGTGLVVLGNFSTIDWANGPYFLQIETDPDGGTNYTITGTNQLLSVPYAIHAKTADSLTDIDSFSWSITGNTGTNDTTNFIGTIDNEPLVFKVNNVRAGKIHPYGYNTSFGYNALNSDYGTFITAIGRHALSINTGNYNTATGFSALKNNTTGGGNTAFGRSTLYDNNTGDGNTAIGDVALSNNVAGSSNTAIGNGALNNNTQSYNTATGFRALYSNTIGVVNTASGYQSLYSNTTGNHNTANGNEALYENTSGQRNTATGSTALQKNEAGNDNTAFGFTALQNNTNGSENTATGRGALFSNTTGYENTAHGEMTLYTNSTGVQNTAIGSEALFSNTVGFYNTAIGRGTLTSNSIGDNNTAVGRSTLFSNTTADYNTAVGAYSLYDNSSGYENTAIGTFSLYNTTTAGRNVAVGYEAGFNNSTGFYNTAVGWGSGPNTWDHKNTTAIGRGATTTAWNQVRIGNNIVTSIGGYAGWSNISDKRFKKEIKNDIVGLDFIMALQPVSYQLDMDKLEQNTGNNRHASDSSYKETEEERDFNIQSKIEKSSIRQSGFLAQDVEQAALSVGYDFSGVDKPKNEDDFYGLRYAEFVVPLVKAIQEQQEIIIQLKKEIELQSAEKITQNNNYEKLLERIEQLEGK